jgi:hypothetical protein
MTKQKSKSRRNKSTFDIFIEHVYALNNSKFFAGIVMLIMNIGSKYITIELSKSQEDYIKYTLGRQILVFAILWMGTRDIVVALILTCVFILFADYLLNDNSKFFIIPDKCSNMINQLDVDGDGKISSKEINDAIHILKKARRRKQPQESSKEEDKFIQKGLYKENFI